MVATFLFTLFPLPEAGAGYVPIDLRTWKQEGVRRDGSWAVTGDGSSVFQSINGGPTFFVGPGTVTASVLRGSMKVEPNLDDDFVGFVLGYRAPLAAGGTDPAYVDAIVFDWKRTSQTCLGGATGAEGLTLYRLRGVVTWGGTCDDNSKTATPCMWSKDKAKCPLDLTVFGRDHGAGKGWVPGVEYTVEISYAPNRIKVWIQGGDGTYKEGVTVFDVPGFFGTGHFGFYNFSQESVRYRLFRENHLPIAVIAPIPEQECIAGGADVQLDGSRSHDPDGDPFTLLWSADGIDVADPTAARTWGRFPFGGTLARLTASDAIGSTSDTEVVLVNDRRPPVSAATLAGRAGEDGWWVSDVTATFEAWDSCSEAEAWVSIDDARFAVATAIVVHGDGVHRLRHYAKDRSGNTETPHVRSVPIDQTPPEVLILKPTTGHAYVNDQEAPLPFLLPVTVVAGDVTLELSAFDATSGIDRVEVRVDGVLRATLTSDLTFRWEAGKEAFGEHVLLATAYDRAGNSMLTATTVRTVPTTGEGLERTVDGLPDP